MMMVFSNLKEKRAQRQRHTLNDTIQIKELNRSLNEFETFLWLALFSLPFSLYRIPVLDNNLWWWFDGYFLFSSIRCMCFFFVLLQRNKSPVFFLSMIFLYSEFDSPFVDGKKETERSEEEEAQPFIVRSFLLVSYVYHCLWQNGIETMY